MKYLTRMFNEINDEFFGGYLDKPEFLCSHTGKVFGMFWVHEGKPVICVNPVHCNNYAKTFGTVAHEMIHYFLIYEYNDWTHGKRFAKMAIQLEKFYKLQKGSI